EITQFLMDSIPEAETILTVTAPGFTGAGAVNSGFGNVRLSDPDERERTQAEIVQMTNNNLRRFNFGQAFAIQEQTIAVQRGGGGFPISFVLENLNFDKLAKALPEFLDAANSSPAFQGVDVDLKVNKPELNMTIDRAKASQLGISVSDISQALQLALSGGRMGYFTKNGRQYQIVGQVQRDDRDEPVSLRYYYVRSNSGEMVSMDNVVRIEESLSPSQIYHYDRYKSATITANPAPGVTLGEGIRAMQDIFEKLKD